jgi:hypothetical protein
LIGVVGVEEYEAICGDGRSREVEEKGSEASFNALLNLARCCCCGQKLGLAIKRLEEVGFEPCTARYDSL